MRRRDLEHIIRAAGAITESSELVILGSQAILGSYPEAPVEILASQEADLYPLKEPEKADLIDGSIGELSPFHEAFGYYARGVGPETATLPDRWRERLVPVCNQNTHGVTGFCLSPPDLAASKLAAGREKDVSFVASLLRHRLVTREDINDLLEEFPQSLAERVSRAIAAL